MSQQRRTAGCVGDTAASRALSAKGTGPSQGPTRLGKNTRSWGTPVTRAQAEGGESHLSS